MSYDASFTPEGCPRSVPGVTLGVRFLEMATKTTYSLRIPITRQGFSGVRPTSLLKLTISPWLEVIVALKTGSIAWHIFRKRSKCRSNRRLATSTSPLNSGKVVADTTAKGGGHSVLSNTMGLGVDRVVSIHPWDLDSTYHSVTARVQGCYPRWST